MNPIVHAERMKRCWIAASVALLLVGCGGGHGRGAHAGQPTYVREGYACCNLRFEDDWISDANVSSLPFVPAGTPIRVKSISGHRAYVDVGGRPMRLGLDYGYERETTAQWVDKLVVPDDPKLRIASFPEPVRAAIGAGQVMTGMTKEQVLMALGYPRADLNPLVNAPFWRYTWSSSVPYAVHWSDGRVSRIDSNHEAIQAITYIAY